MVESLDFRKLRYVVAAAQTRSFTAAAKALAITQPALTRCIAEVEADLGMQIFLRLPRGVSVTEEGEKFVGRARKLLADLESLGEDFTEGATASRTLRVGASPGTYLALAAPALADFASEHSDLDIETTAGRPEDVIPKLGTGELDVVLSTSDYLERWSDIVVEQLEVLEYSYMVRKGHPLEGHNQVTLEEVLKFPSVLPATIDWMHMDMAVLYEKRGLKPAKPAYVTDDLNFVFSLLNRTDAYFPMVTTAQAIAELSEDFHMIRLERPNQPRYLCLAYSRTRPVATLVKSLTGALRTAMSTG